MARSVNRITLIGNVGRDPDIQQTKNGTKVAHFSGPSSRLARFFPLPTGRYRLEASMGDQPLGFATVEIGAGTQTFPVVLR